MTPAEENMSADAPPAVEVRGLTKRFGKVTVLDRIDLTVGAGQFMALLGPSGCGKTTLLRCLAGFETPDEGEIVIGGKVVFSSTKGLVVPPGQRDLGMVFQSYGLWPHMRVSDNVGFGLELKGMARAERERRIEQVLADVGLAGLGHRYPSELSGGQQQRVALARLLATRPPLFLMDEPLSNLDARLRMDMRAELKRLHREARVATAYVTHDQSEAMTLADLVAVMIAGRIEQASPPRQLYREPATVSVAEFIGMPRMNILPGQVRDGTLTAADIALALDWQPARGEVTVAARPEDLDLTTEPVQGSTPFEIDAVFHSGPETLLLLKRGEHRLYARADHRREYLPDQLVHVRLRGASVNLFDPASRSLLRRAA
jgi:ABC-type sugar transport system ATPase subunit